MREQPLVGYNTARREIRSDTPVACRGSAFLLPLLDRLRTKLNFMQSKLSIYDRHPHGTFRCDKWHIRAML